MKNSSRRLCLAQLYLAAPALAVAGQVQMPKTDHILLGPFDTFKVLLENQKNYRTFGGLGALPGPRFEDIGGSILKSRFYLLDLFGKDGKRNDLPFSEQFQVLLSGNSSGSWKNGDIDYSLSISNGSISGFSINRASGERKIDLVSFEIKVWAEKADYFAKCTSIFSTKEDFITYKDASN